MSVIGGRSPLLQRVAFGPAVLIHQAVFEVIEEALERGQPAFHSDFGESPRIAGRESVAERDPPDGRILERRPIEFGLAPFVRASPSHIFTSALNPQLIADHHRGLRQMRRAWPLLPLQAMLAMRLYLQMSEQIKLGDICRTSSSALVAVVEIEARVEFLEDNRHGYPPGMLGRCKLSDVHGVESVNGQPLPDVKRIVVRDPGGLVMVFIILPHLKKLIDADPTGACVTLFVRTQLTSARLITESSCPPSGAE